MTPDSHHHSERRAFPDAVIQTADILIVDDRPENLIAMEATLKSREYNLFTAQSGEEALTFLKSHPVALVLLDIQMPGMDGYETARRIASDPSTRGIPVMMVSAIFKEDEHVRKGYEVGAVDYIGKPFDIDVLRRKVGIYTQLHQQRMNLRRQEDQQKLIDAQLIARREELEQRSAQITTLLETITDAIFVVWGNKITESNTAALRMFGYDNYDAMSQPVGRFLESIRPRDAETGERLDGESHPYFQALKGEKSYGQVVIKNVKTGFDQVLRCSAHPVRFREKILGVVMVHAPVSVS